jgi:uncharacterized damage-inducible protein DinB
MDAMRLSDLRVLVDYHYWATRRVLAAAERLTDDEFRRTSGGTTRELRETLVHALDVEWSWRRRLQGEPSEAWEAELALGDFPNVQALFERWTKDEAEMRAWIDGLSDDDLETTPAHVKGEIGAPLWFYVMHILTHGTLQRADAAVLLTHAGRSTGDLDFLDFADSLGFQRGDGSPDKETS